MPCIKFEMICISTTPRFTVILFFHIIFASWFSSSHSSSSPSWLLPSSRPRALHNNVRRRVVKRRNAKKRKAIKVQYHESTRYHQTSSPTTAEDPSPTPDLLNRVLISSSAKTAERSGMAKNIPSISSRRYVSEQRSARARWSDLDIS